MRRRLIGILAAAALTLAITAPAFGIVYGEIDEDNVYSNVGALIYDFEDEGKLIICSGTLIAPKIFLTAAHCIFDPDAETWWVSFDQPITEPVSKSTNKIYSGKAHPHPNFACCGADDTFDIAVVVLDKAVRGITPAGLPTENQLGEMTAQELKAATFVAVGYGTVREDKEGAFQSIEDVDGWRRFAEQSVNSLTDAWLTLSMNEATDDGGTCYGDSGGPHFLNGTVMSLTVTGDVWCKATDKTYRVDTPVARDFLDDFVSVP